MTIGANIKYLREKYNLSQQDFGKITHVNNQNVSLWEKDRILPPLAKLMLISEHFQISLDILVNGNVEELTGKNYYNVIDYGLEARNIFDGLSSKQQDQLLRTMYQFKIESERHSRPTPSFTDRQLVATLFESPDPIIKEFGSFLKRFLEQHEQIHVSTTKELLLDIVSYLSLGKAQTNEFLTLKRNIIDLLLPLSSFEFIKNKDILTIDTISKQFHLDPFFVLIALEYYISCYGPIFSYKDIEIDLSSIKNKENNQTAYDKSILITSTK